MNLWGKTDIGQVRPMNQDAFDFFYKEDSESMAGFAVCDGMGGAKAGHIASQLALDTFIEAVRSALKPGLSAEKLAEELKNAAKAANSSVFAEAARDKAYAGMGTTLVGGMISGENAAIVNVGDSRCYRIGESGISRITRDHSLVEELVLRGELTEAEAAKHPHKNFITRALGADREVEADVYLLTLAPGECLLLCSDGLSNQVSEQEILYEVLHGETREQACDRLVTIANQRGGYDNITVLLVEV